MAPFSYQLYSSRKFPPLSDTLKMLTDAGYRQVEGFGGLFADPAAVSAVREALSATGLDMPSGHFGLDMVENAPEEVLDIARGLNIEAVIVPSIPENERPGDGDGWHALGRRLDEVGKPFRDAGMVFGYHNHAFEFQATPAGETPMERLLEGGRFLKWEIDVAWVVRGGADPLNWIAAHADRIVAAHIKDIAPEGANQDEDGWADVGHGAMDWPAIMEALQRTPCRYFVMEHDNPSDDRRFAERSIAAATAFDKESA